MAVEKKVTVTNLLGLHARASARLVNLANQYHSAVSLSRTDTQSRADAKSILSVMFLAAVQGTELIVHASGDDENAAIAAIAGLFENNFEEYSHVF
jgi:phosphocarrier protein